MKSEWGCSLPEVDYAKYYWENLDASENLLIPSESFLLSMAIETQWHDSRMQCVYMVYGLIFQRKESDGQEYICQGRMILEIYVVTAVGRKKWERSKGRGLSSGLHSGWRFKGSGQVKWGGVMPTMWTLGHVGALPSFARPVQMLTTESETDR